eukprot:11556_1
MGCVSSLPTSINDAKKTSILSKPQSVKYKILLLGAAQCGKSTLLRQFKRLHGRMFTESEFLESKKYFAHNLIRSMKDLARYAYYHHEYITPEFVAAYFRHECNLFIVPECIETLCFMFVDKNGTPMSPIKDEICKRVAEMSSHHNIHFTSENYEDFWQLWTDPYFSKIYYEYGNEIGLMDNTEYLFNRMYNYCQYGSDYIPKFEDLLHVYDSSSGINKIKFELDQYVTYEIYDLPGERQLRRKWIHYVDNTSAIIYVVALSGYNQTLSENSKLNRMKEAIGLFRGIVNLSVFKDTHIIMFLNKSDIFCKKIGKYSVKKYFKDYTGSDDNKDEIIHFFKCEFRAQWKTKPNR